NLSGIGMTGLFRDRRLTVDNRHLKALPSQIIGAGGTHNAAAKNQNMHCLTPRPRSGVNHDCRIIGEPSQLISLFYPLYLALNPVQLAKGLARFTNENQTQSPTRVGPNRSSYPS